jgi:hypothetical protein
MTFASTGSRREHDLDGLDGPFDLSSLIALRPSLCSFISRGTSFAQTFK